MPVKRLTRSGAGEQCGDAELISGGMPDPLGTGQAPPEPELPLEALVGAVLGGTGAEKPTPDVAEHASGGWEPNRLQQAASTVIAELHRAKQELAMELEANLKQLQAVLKETQRIARDMEAVLKEAKAEPKEEQGLGGGKAAAGSKPKAPWNPPTLKDDNAGDDADSSESGQDVKEWNPPEDALQH